MTTDEEPRTLTDEEEATLRARAEAAPLGYVRTREGRGIVLATETIVDGRPSTHSMLPAIVATLDAERTRADALQARLDEIAKLLPSLRNAHNYCEDSWYSCPLAQDGCADDRQSGCNCGADEHNTRVDEIVKLAKGTP